MLCCAHQVLEPRNSDHRQTETQVSLVGAYESETTMSLSSGCPCQPNAATNNYKWLWTSHTIFVKIHEASPNSSQCQWQDAWTSTERQKKLLAHGNTMNKTLQLLQKLRQREWRILKNAVLTFAKIKTAWAKILKKRCLDFWVHNFSCIILPLRFHSKLRWSILSAFLFLMYSVLASLKMIKT